MLRSVITHGSPRRLGRRTIFKAEVSTAQVDLHDSVRHLHNTWVAIERCIIQITCQWRHKIMHHWQFATTVHLITMFQHCYTSVKECYVALFRLSVGSLFLSTFCTNIRWNWKRYNFDFSTKKNNIGVHNFCSFFNPDIKSGIISYLQDGATRLH